MPKKKKQTFRSNKGSISLLDFDLRLVYFAQYAHIHNRNEIIARWRSLVGKKMDRMYIQIAPDYTPSRVKPRK